MKIIKVFFILITASCIHCREYYYNAPAEPFPNEDVKLLNTVIKANNGKTYEVSMTASRKVYETRVNQIQNEAISSADQYHAIRNTSPNPTFYENLQQTLLNNKQNVQINSPQYANNAAYKTDYTAYANNNEQYGINNQQQQQQEQHIQQQPLYLQQNLQPQEQRHLPTNSLLSQYQPSLQQPQHNNNLPNSQTLLNDLVAQQKYISQSEASQLDVYPYKQINDDTRPFTRVITKCDTKGHCEQQYVSDGGHGDNDFLHQQVLKQTKAQTDYNTVKCQNKFNYQYTGNALVDNAAKAQRGIPIKKGTDLKNRRLIPYTELIIPQYPHN